MRFPYTVQFFIHLVRRQCRRDDLIVRAVLSLPVVNRYIELLSVEHLEPLQSDHTNRLGDLVQEYHVFDVD